MWLKILAEIIIIFVILVVGISYYVYYTYSHPPKLATYRTPADFKIPFEEITFQSTDGVNLKGWFIPSESDSKKTIIITHGYPANKSDVLDWGLFLRKKYNLFYFDFRGHGQSEGDKITFGYKEVNDIKGAINYLETREEVVTEKIGIMGFSMGGVTGLLTATSDARIKAIVADSAFASLEGMVHEVYRRYAFLRWPFVKFGKLMAKSFLKIDLDEVSLEKKANQIKTPVLLIHAKNDPVIPSSNSQTIYDNLAGHKEIWLTDSSDHGANYYFFQEEYEQKVLNFFEQYLN